MFSFRTFKGQLVQILSLQESPHRTALAFAIGVFIAFAPHYGFHTVSTVFCAWLFRLNYLAVFLGSLINNPWTVFPILALTLSTGFLFFGMPQPSQFDWQEMNVENIFQTISLYVVLFAIGGCMLGLIGALASYFIILFVIHRYRATRG